MHYSLVRLSITGSLVLVSFSMVTFLAEGGSLLLPLLAGCAGIVLGGGLLPRRHTSPLLAAETGWGLWLCFFTVVLPATMSIVMVSAFYRLMGSFPLADTEVIGFRSDMSNASVFIGWLSNRIDQLTYLLTQPLLLSVVKELVLCLPVTAVFSFVTGPLYGRKSGWPDSSVPRVTSLPQPTDPFRLQ